MIIIDFLPDSWFIPGQSLGFPMMQVDFSKTKKYLFIISFIVANARWGLGVYSRGCGCSGGQEHLPAVLAQGLLAVQRSPGQYPGHLQEARHQSGAHRVALLAARSRLRVFRGGRWQVRGPGQSHRRCEGAVQLLQYHLARLQGQWHCGALVPAAHTRSGSVCQSDPELWLRAGLRSSGIHRSRVPQAPQVLRRYCLQLQAWRALAACGLHQGGDRDLGHYLQEPDQVVQDARLPGVQSRLSPACGQLWLPRGQYSPTRGCLQLFEG